MKNSSELLVLAAPLPACAASPDCVPKDDPQLRKVASTRNTRRTSRRPPSPALRVRVPEILLIPKRLDRIQMRGLISRIEAEEDPHGGRENHGDEKRLYWNSSRPS